MKDFPQFTTVKYYYSDKTTSDTFLFGECPVASLVLTEDGVIYLSLNSGVIITPYSCNDDRLIPTEWTTQRSIKYAIEHQPYDFDDVWAKFQMYSKEFWNLAYQDIRDFKIKISLNEI